MKVKDLLIKKACPVVTIGPDDSFVTATQKLVENNIGALPVCDAKGTLVGIVSERDLLKECSQHFKGIGNTKVKDMMTREVAIGTPEDELNYVMNIMTQKGIRHLPILDGPRLEGIISMRDMVETQLSECETTVRFLNEYIAGGYV